MDEIKDVWWEGSSLDDLKQFPEDVKLAMGYQLHPASSSFIQLHPASEGLRDQSFFRQEHFSHSLRG